MARSESNSQQMTDPDSWDTFDYGDVVVDRESDDSRAVVVALPSKPIEEWNVRGRGTVAEDNPTYPADDRVVCVMYQATLAASYPYYSGIKPLSLSTLNRENVKFYAFPSSRLRAVDRLKSHTVDLDEVRPSPYHARSFCAAENREFIEQIRKRGDLDKNAPLLRPIEDGFEILNGHKRIWAAHVAGLSCVTGRCIYSSDGEAARTFVNAHLDSYDRLERQKAIQTILARFETKTAHEIMS